MQHSKLFRRFRALKVNLQESDSRDFLRLLKGKVDFKDEMMIVIEKQPVTWNRSWLVV